MVHRTCPWAKAMPDGPYIAASPNMRAMAPGLKIVGAISPPFAPSFSTEENAEMVAAINAAAPDALFVGLEAPKQELWLSEHHDALNVPLRMGVGAAFDFTAGTKKQASERVSQLGLEWLVRWADEPKRLSLRLLKSFGIFPYFAQKNGLEVLRFRAQKEDDNEAG